MSEQWNDSEDVQMPLGVGNDSEFTPDEGQSKPKMNGPTLVLFIAFAAGLLLIYVLGVQSKPQKASAAQLAREAQVKSAIADLLAKNGKAEKLDSLFDDTDKLMKMFHAYFGGEFKAPPALEHDPFANDDDKADATPLAQATEIVSNSRDAEKLRRVAESFAALKLQSVFLAGSNSMAIINGRTVSVGQKFGDLTVAEIQADRVILKYGQNSFKLMLNSSPLNAR